MSRKIAILLTCFNRKEMTLQCLESLSKAKQHYESDNQGTLECEVFLVDDNSKDGTGGAVKARFPSVHVIQGTGSLYWAGGMRLSWIKALEFSTQWDYFFLINDDVVFNERAFNILLSTATYKTKPAIVSGLVCDSEDHTKVTYGGEIWRNHLKGTTTRLGYSDKPQMCDMANANALLIPYTVYAGMGGFDTEYTHGCADYDYTVRARKKGYDVLLTPGAVGVCRNDHKKNDDVLAKLAQMTFNERRAYYKNPLHSSKDYLRYIRKVVPSRYPQVLFGRFIALYFPKIYNRLNNIR